MSVFRNIPHCIIYLIPVIPALSFRTCSTIRTIGVPRTGQEIPGFCFPRSSLESVIQIRSRSMISKSIPQLQSTHKFRGLQGHVIRRTSMSQDRPSKKVVIIGGGLAGLAVAYNLLDLTKTLDIDNVCVTIVDAHEVGQGGASGVMAGLLHPLTPRGKKLWMVRQTAPARIHSNLVLLHASGRTKSEYVAP